MDTSYEILAQNLASHIVDLRKKRRLTQAALAKLAGIPRSTVANMECGMGNPSLYNLTKICGALQVPVEELLSTPRSQTKLIRKEDIPVNKRSRGNVVVYKLLPDLIPGMAIDRMELEVGARMGGIPHSAGTKEYLHCVQGQITAVISGESFDLRAGDVLVFPGESAHHYINAGPSKAIGLSVVTIAPMSNF
ncbi:anaerobic benzoate catabolism transcriptional regulator [compost metagenome]